MPSMVDVLLGLTFLLVCTCRDFDSYSCFASTGFTQTSLSLSDYLSFTHKHTNQNKCACTH